MDITSSENIASYPKFLNLGPEPLSDHFDFKQLLKALAARKGPIKPILLDQKLVAGIGNIYASESLFLAKIRPNKKSNKLNRQNYIDLVASIKKILKLAIKKGGTSIKDFKTIDGKPGYFSQDLSVYGRKNCPSCGKSSRLKKLKINGRTSFFCNICQQ